MTTESVNIDGVAFPIKPISKTYEGDPEQALRFVDIKALLDSHKVGDMITVKSSGFAFFKGYHDATNIVLFVGDKVAFSFNRDRTTGKQVYSKMKAVLENIGLENGDRLRGAEVIYTFKVLEGLEGNYLSLVKMEFTGVVKDFESNVEVLGADVLKNTAQKQPAEEKVTEITVGTFSPSEYESIKAGKKGGVDYSKFLNQKVKH